MKIKMLESVRGSLDGETVVDLERGAEYQTEDSPRGDRMARAHVERGHAVVIDDVGEHESSASLDQ